MLLIGFQLNEEIVDVKLFETNETFKETLLRQLSSEKHDNKLH